MTRRCIQVNNEIAPRARKNLPSADSVIILARARANVDGENNFVRMQIFVDAADAPCDKRGVETNQSRSADETEGTVAMAQITYGDHTRDLDKLPATSLVALASAGFAHTLGNVVASKISSELHAVLDPSAPEGMSKEQAKAWFKAEAAKYRVANPAKITEWNAMHQAAVLKAIDEGTLGVHAARGPSASADPLMAEMRKLAKVQISDILAAAQMKFPGKVKGVEQTVTLKGVAYTGEQLIANRLDPAYERNNRKAIEDEAKRNLAARKREAERHAQAGVDAL